MVCYRLHFISGGVLGVKAEVQSSVLQNENLILELKKCHLKFYKIKILSFLKSYYFYFSLNFTMKPHNSLDNVHFLWVRSYEFVSEAKVTQCRKHKKRECVRRTPVAVVSPRLWFWCCGPHSTLSHEATPSAPSCTARQKEKS